MTPHVCPPDHRHGENLTCHGRHRCRCVECRRAKAEYEFWYRHMRAAGHPRPRPVDARGVRRRLQALVALGWSLSDLARFEGVHVGTVWIWVRAERLGPSIVRRVEALYDLLSMTLPVEDSHETRQVASRARGMARRRGWVPPLAWDDIDTDDAPAAPVAVRWLELVDTVVVDRAVVGDDPGRSLTPAERREAVRALHVRRYSDALIAQSLGCSDKTVLRIRQDLRLEAWVQPVTAWGEVAA